MTAMQLLFVADPLAGFNTAKDSTFAMMREAAKRGHTIVACEPGQMRWQQGGCGASPTGRWTSPSRADQATA